MYASLCALVLACVTCCSAALRAKLEEDRKERRRKLGLPEELTDEEKAREADKARKKAEEEEAKRHVYVKPITGVRTGGGGMGVAVFLQPGGVCPTL